MTVLRVLWHIFEAAVIILVLALAIIIAFEKGPYA